MLDKETFSNLLDTLEYYMSGLDELENTLNTKFNQNFLTTTIDNIIITIAKSFLAEDNREEIDKDICTETVTDILYHYVFEGEFGLHTEQLTRLYIEDEGLETEEAFDACNNEQLYALIMRYLHPVRICKTFLLNL